jgi:hypothetical protein
MVPIPLLSILIYSIRCEYDILKGLLKKLTITCPLGRSNMTIGFLVGLILGFWWVFI